jgi:G patch domain-containing protein 1
MADAEDEDYHYVGTPLEDEEEGRASAYRRPVKDAATLRTLPVWKQEVTDEQGRKRFHGAFTGGYSAGYFNTVGSAVGQLLHSARVRARLHST